MKEKLIITRNFLYRFFVIGFLLSVLFQAVLMFNHEFIFTYAATYAGISKSGIALLLSGFIGTTRLFLFYLVLCPAIALHWTVKREKSLQ